MAKEIQKGEILQTLWLPELGLEWGSGHFIGCQFMIWTDSFLVSPLHVQRTNFMGRG